MKMAEDEPLLQETTLLAHCRTLAKKIELDELTKKLIERNRLFKMISDRLTNTTRIKNLIAKAIANGEKSCSILKIECCPCLTSEEARIYSGFHFPDLGREFIVRIYEGTCFEIRVDW